jgi:glycosyltransferase involved in cell wall biosynthesis
VTALCLTRNRRDWLPKAIRCYQLQRHQSKELLIIADGADVSDLIPSDPTIRLVHIAEGLEIGGKRNFGCSRAAGEVIAHWDDDDWSDPGRMQDQLDRLRESGKAVTGYSAMRFTDGLQWWQYRGEHNYALGTSLCYRRDWWANHRFLSLQRGEDDAFTRAAWNAGQLSTADAGQLMFATNHPGNTSPRSMGSNFKPL